MNLQCKCIKVHPLVKPIGTQHMTSTLNFAEIVRAITGKYAG